MLGTNANNSTYENEGFELLDIITMLSFILQIENYTNDRKEADNNSIMRALDAQNKNFLGQILDNQKVIIQNQEEILSLLRK